MKIILWIILLAFMYFASSDSSPDEGMCNSNELENFLFLLRFCLTDQ